MRHAPSWPWLTVAVVQAIGIAFLALQLGTEPVAGEIDRTVPASAPTFPGDGVTSSAQPSEPAQPVVEPPTAPRVAAASADLGTLLCVALRLPEGHHATWSHAALSSGDQTTRLAAERRGETGICVFPGLAAGDYHLRASAEGMRPIDRVLVLPPAMPSMRVDLTFEPSWFVKVLLLAPDGRPLHEALADDKELARAAPVSVIAGYGMLPAQLPLSDLRDTPLTVGTWQSTRGLGGRTQELPARYAGTLEMREHRDAVVAAVLREVVLVQVPVQAGQDEVTLTVDPRQLRALLAGVRLQVVDAGTGKPLTDARVELHDAQTRQQPVAVDADGRFEQGNLRPGRYQLSIQVEGHAGPSASVDLLPGRTTDVGTIPVAAAFELVVHVTGVDDGTPVYGSLQQTDAFAHAALAPAPIRVAGRNGELRADIAPGRYGLRLSGSDRGACVDFDTRRLGSEPLVVALASQPSIRVTPSSAGEPMRLVLQDSNGLVAYDRWITWTTPFSVSLPAGDYRVRIERVGGEARDELLTVPAEGVRYVLH